MAGLEDLNFEPSKKLSFITGLVEGITELHKNTKAEEAAKAKSQFSLMRQLLPTLFRERGEQRRFDVREARETKEFGLEFAEQQQQNAAALSKIQAQIANWQESIRIADAKLDIEQDRVGLEERRVVNAEAQTIIDSLQNQVTNLIRQAEEAGRTTRARESIESTEGIAARALGGITQRFETTQQAVTVKDIRNRFDAKAEKLQSYQEELVDPESRFKDDPGLSQLAVAQAQDLTADWVQLVRFAQTSGAPVPQRPPQLELYKDDAWYKKATFGVAEAIIDTSKSEIQPKRKDLLPTLTKPAAVDTTPVALPEASNKVQAAIDAAKEGGHKTLSQALVNGLKNVGYSDEEIEQVRVGL